MPVIEGERAQDSLRRTDRHGPTGAQTVLQREVAIGGPERMTGDILDDHRFVSERRSSAGPDRGPDGDAIKGLAVGLR